MRSLSGREAAQAGWPGPCQNPQNPGHACAAGVKCCQWHQGTQEAQGVLWFMSHGHQHSLWSQHLCQSQGTLCQGTASREAALRGYRWAQVGAHGGMHTQGRHRTAHTRAHAGTCRHGHMDPVHTSVRSKMCTKVPMWAHLPGLTACLHVQPARSDLGKHPGVHVPAQQGGDTGGCYSRQCQGVTRRAQPDTHHGDIRAQAPGGLGVPHGCVGGSGGGFGGLKGYGVCAHQRCRAAGRWCWRRR